MSRSEIRRTWLSVREREAIRKRSRLALHRLEEGIPNICPRGLERYRPASMQKRAEMRALIYETVFNMQELHRRTGKRHPEALASFCRKRSASSQKDAHAIALSDAKEVQRIERARQTYETERQGSMEACT